MWHHLRLYAAVALVGPLDGSRPRHNLVPLVDTFDTALIMFSYGMIALQLGQSS